MRQRIGLILLMTCAPIAVSAQMPNLRVCANESVPVEARDDYEFYSYTPADAVLWQVFWRARLNPTVTTDYTLRARRRLPRELLDNAGFTAGTTGFTSDLDFSRTRAFPGGTAAAVRRASEVEGDHIDCPAPGGERNDRFLAVNLRAGQSARLACQRVTVAEGAEYRFEARVASLRNGAPLGFSWTIDGAVLGVSVRSDPSACTWRRFARDYLASASGAVEVCVAGTADGDADAAAGLDDLSFRRYDEDLVETFRVTVSPAPAPTEVEVAVCAGARYRRYGLDLAIGQRGERRIPLSAGCDSVISYLAVEAPVEGLVDSVTVGPVCAGAEVEVGGECFVANADTTVVRALVARGGCDSTVVARVDVFDGGDVATELVPPACGLANGIYSVALPVGASLSWDDGSAARRRVGLGAGDSLSGVFTSAGGCAARLGLRLPGGEPAPVVTLTRAVACVGDSATVAFELAEGVGVEVAPLPGPPSALGAGGADAAGGVLRFRESATARLAPGAYRLAWSGSDGCVTELPLEVEGAPAPRLRIVGGSVRRLGLPLAIAVEANDGAGLPELTWSYGGEPLPPEVTAGGRLRGWRPETEGELAVTYVDTLGCTVTLRQAIRLERARDVALADAFSPNGDGVNDALRLNPHPGIVRAISTSVYDRWGGELHRADDVVAGGVVWDGRGAPSGAYVLVSALALQDGTVARFTVTAELVR